MSERKPRSQAQRDAQLTAMEAARGAAARRAEAKRKAERERADREAAEAAEAARLREARGGFELGDRVTGRERVFGTERTGVVVAGPPSEVFAGVHVIDDEGTAWTLGRYTVKAAE